jgi:internalin A
LDLSNNAVYDLSGLAALESLSTVDLSNNQVSDLSALSNCSHLYDLVLKGNQISDLGQFLELSWWLSSSYGGRAILDVSDNPIDCTAQARNIQALKEIPVQVVVDCPNSVPP